MTKKQRLTALDFDKAFAMKELRSVVEAFKNINPMEWLWTVGTPERSSTIVSVTISDQQIGYTATHHVPVYLPMRLMEEEVAKLAANAIRYRQSRLEAA